MTSPKTHPADELFALDSRVRYVAVLDRNHKLIESRMRSSVHSLTPENYDRKFMGSVPPLVFDTLSQLEEQCGPLSHMTIQYEKVDFVFFRNNNQVLVVSLEPGPMEPFLRKLRDNFSLKIHL